MCFVIIRLVFWGAAFIIGFLLMRKLQISHKRHWAIAAVVLMVFLATLFSLTPVENAFIKFSSPVAAYHYNHSGEIRLIVAGEESDFIVGAKGDECTYAIVPKSNGHWKIGMGFDTKRIFQATSDGIVIYVYQYKNSSDHFITAMDTNGGELDITDSHNSEFKCMEESNDILGKEFYTYYAYVDGFDDDYCITIDGQTLRAGDMG